jgi:hypothetical protein
MSLHRIGLSLLVVLLAAPNAVAQQTACRSYYRAGEYVPPGCQERLRSAPPIYQSWGGGFGSGTSNLPPASHQGWRYFGGYNALYGFGR